MKFKVDDIIRVKGKQQRFKIIEVFKEDKKYKCQYEPLIARGVYLTFKEEKIELAV